MQPNSGPDGAESFVHAYEKAYLLELRAGLVVTNGVVIAQRLFAYKEKLAPEVGFYLKALPEMEQPASLNEMHFAVRKWAEIQREGQTYPTNKSWDYINELGDCEDQEAKAKSEREKKEKE